METAGAETGTDVELWTEMGTEEWNDSEGTWDAGLEGGLLGAVDNWGKDVDAVAIREETIEEDGVGDERMEDD